MNWIFVVLVVGAVVVGAFTGTMHGVTEAGIEQAKTAVTLSLSLIGQMALWLGFFGVLKEAGALRSIANLMRPVMTRLFPEVPPDHPAMSAMILNFSANMLGLANAATPFGLKAMAELNKLNTRPGVATNSMALFLAINNSGIALLQLGVVAMRAITGSKDPAGILVPSFLGSLAHTLFAIGAAKFLQSRSTFALEKYPVDASAVTKELDASKLSEAEAVAKEVQGASGARLGLVVLVILAMLGALGLHFQRRLAATEPQPIIKDEKGLWAPRDADRPLFVGAPVVGFAKDTELGAGTIVEVAENRVRLELASSAEGLSAVRLPAPTFFLVLRTILSDWILPGIMLAIVLIGFGRKVRVYEAFIPAAKEGFQTGVMIIPYLVAILVLVGMFRASGALDAIMAALSPIASTVGFPAEAMPMALIRPLSGSAATGVLTESLRRYGPDTYIGYLVSMLNGSSETTFYVLSVYFGAVGIRSVRHTLAACLLTDAVGIVVATAMCRLFFG